MNTIIKYTIDGKTFEFDCTSYGNRSGFAHKVNCYNNGLFEYRVQYYNRTWERFQFESAIYGIVGKMLKAAEKSCYENAREVLGKARLTKEEKESALATSGEYVELLRLKNRIGGETPKWTNGDYFRSIYEAC